MEKSKNITAGFILGLVLLIILQLPADVLATSYDPSHYQQEAPGNETIYLPFITKPTPLMLGLYTDGYLGWQSTFDNEIKPIDSWSGKHLTIIGTFIGFEDLNPAYNIPVPLGMVWDAGYTPFVNILTNKKLSDINAGNIDSQIRDYARAFKTWRDQGLVKGQNRRAFLAPFPEMDGDWVSYHGTPAEFLAAFSRIQSLFNQEGASPAIRWVFAPNGWSPRGEPKFEEYYPGDNAVEVIGFSGYNSGYCPTAVWKSWTEPIKVYEPYIQRIRALTPTKPIFVAQTATTAYNRTGFSIQSKNQWLIDAYNYLASEKGVSAIIYFNMSKNQSCDWAFYQPEGLKFEGYPLGVNNDNYIYISPNDLAFITLQP